MASPRFIEAAPAKINLYLHLTGQRADGYHLLDSLTVFAHDIADRIHIADSDRFSFSISGPFADALTQTDTDKNLAVRAARLYTEMTGKGEAVTIVLEKNIPSGAGLGGGSADAAAVIRAMEKIFETDLPDRISNLLRLGADVPVCYHASACRFEGIGEHISTIPPLPSLFMLIVWPSCHSSTQDVFALRTSGFSKTATIPASFGNTQQFIEFLNSTRNDLVDAAVSLNPDIKKAADLAAQQDGCLLSRMSGSGSAVFGLFDNNESCTLAQKTIQTAQPAWWVQTTKLA